MLTLARISAGRVLGCRQLVLRGAAGRMFATDERPTMLASIQKAPVSQNLLLRQVDVGCHLFISLHNHVFILHSFSTGRPAHTHICWLMS